MKFEIEQKFPLAEREPFLSRLTQLSARPHGECRQEDRYFNHPGRDFAATDEALRIRSVGNDNFVTYKGPKLSGPTKSRREIELPLAAGGAGRETSANCSKCWAFAP